MDQDTHTLTRRTADQLDALARRHEKASGGGMAVVNAFGGQADTWLRKLPGPVRNGLDAATRSALEQAARAADFSRSRVPDQPDWVNSAIGSAMGALGGVGGGATTLAELPVTVTLLMRVIQGVAAEHGFDPSEDNVRFDCLTVFASAGPLKGDDGSDTAFLSARMALQGAAVQKIIKTVAPRLAAALGQKLAAQSVPLAGAAAGAAINYAFTSYYRDMAHVHFGLRRLAVEEDISESKMLEHFRRRLAGNGGHAVK